MDRQLLKDSTAGIACNTIRSAAFSSESQHRLDTTTEKDGIAVILKQTAANLHASASFNAPNTFTMVQESNDPETHEELEKILASHFFSLNLANYQSVIAFLLLNCFLLKKESKEKEMIRKLYEDHISLLKEKNSELEDKVLRHSVTQKANTESSLLRDCDSCEELRERMQVMSTQVSQLRQSYDDVSSIITHN